MDAPIDTAVNDPLPTTSRIKPWLKVAWFAFPLLAFSFHLAKGRSLAATDRAITLLEIGRAALAQERWSEAATAFTSALNTAPESRLDLLAEATTGKAKALIDDGDLYDAIDLLAPVLNSPETARALPKPQMDDIRATAAEARYYAGYALKLENAPRELWLTELEFARQLLHVLSSYEAIKNPATSLSPYLLNLELVHRVERETIHDLQGVNIPPPCEIASKKHLIKKALQRSTGNQRTQGDR